MYLGNCRCSDRLLQKYQMFTLPNPSHQGRGLIINPLPLWENQGKGEG
jgi:hypothetical protein